MQNTRMLEQFGVDLVERADRSERIIGRTQEIETVLQILSRRQKNNPALIGEPGVGKTAIVEGVAQYIAEGRVPENLRGKRSIWPACWPGRNTAASLKSACATCWPRCSGRRT